MLQGVDGDVEITMSDNHRSQVAELPYAHTDFHPECCGKPMERLEGISHLEVKDKSIWIIDRRQLWSQRFARYLEGEGARLRTALVRGENLHRHHDEICYAEEVAAYRVRVRR